MRHHRHPCKQHPTTAKVEILESRRLLHAGQLDPSFGSGGKTTVDFHGLGVEATAVATESDGKTVVVGYANHGNGSEASDFAIVRLNFDGSLDTTFGPNHTGIVLLHLGDSDAESGAEAVVVDGQNRILVAGSDNTTAAFDYNVGGDIYVARYLPNGTLDPSFASHGIADVDFGVHNDSDARGIALQSDGKIVVVGLNEDFEENTLGIGSTNFAIARLNTNGSLDQSFNNGGTKTVDFDDGDAIANAVTLDYSGTPKSNPHYGTIVVGGYIGTGGKVTTDFNGASTAADGIAYLGDRIVAAGSGKFDTARYLDTNPDVAAGAFITTASEQGPTPVSFLVTQDQRLPYDNTVNFSIGGTATPPSLASIRFHTEDYTLSGMNVPLLGQAGHPLPPPSVVIPAGQTYVLVTLTPIDDSIPEGMETASFSIIPSTFYNVASPSNVTINILDNDTTAKTIGASADSYVQDGSSANTNFGSSTSLVVKNGSAGLNRFTYLKFDLSSVSTINSVTLQLHGNLSNASNASVVTDVFSVANTSWTESGITFNNAPAAGPNPLASATITGTTPTEYTWDVTAYVKAQKAAGNNIVSFVLKDPLASDSAVILNSREAGNGPSLVIS